MDKTTILANLGADIFSFNNANEAVSTLLDVITAIENTAANINTENASIFIQQIAKAILKADIAMGTMIAA